MQTTARHDTRGRPIAFLKFCLMLFWGVSSSTPDAPQVMLERGTGPTA